MSQKVSSGQMTIYDQNDSITTGLSAPLNPILNQLWCDTSTSPNQLRKWNGSAWEVVNEVKVGGRNLLKKSSIGGAIAVDYFGGNNASYRDITVTQWRINPFTSHDIGNYSLSFWAKSTVAGVLNVDICDSNGTNFNVTTNWKFFKMEAKYVDSVYLNTIYYGIIDFSGPALGLLYLGNIKLELGNIATDWTPAPEDVAADILVAQTAADAANNVIAKIADDDVLTPSEKQQALREWLVAVSEKPLNVTQASNLGVDSGAYSSAYDSLSSFIGTNLNDVTTTWTLGVGNGSLFRNRFSSYYTARTNLLNAISTKVNTSATNANTKIDGLKVGGRNLVPHGDFSTLMSIYTNNWSHLTSSCIVATGGNDGGSFQRIEFSSHYSQMGVNPTVIGGWMPGGSYVLSFWAKTSFITDQYGVGFILRWNYMPISVTAISNPPISVSWQRYVFLIKWGSTVEPTGTAFISILEADGAGNIEFDSLQIELGNIATDWTPAPEDVAADIASAQAAADAAKSKVDLLDYLKDNMIKGGTVEAGMYLSNILAVRNAAGMVTGGVNGLTDNTAKGNVFLWGGGTLDAAENSATNPSGVATIDRKDGSGHRAFGKLLWDALGNLTAGGFRITNGFIRGFEGLFERVRFTTNAITPLSELTSGGWARDTSDFDMIDFFAAAVYNYDLPNDGGLMYNDTVSITLSTAITLSEPTNIKLFTGLLDGLVDFDSPDVYVVNTSEVFEIRSVGNYIPNAAGVQVALQAGVHYITYKVIVDFGFNKGDVYPVPVYITSTGAHIDVQNLAPSRTEIGNNGLFSFWSAAMYFYYDKINGLRVKGATDIPGVLATGSVESGGMQSRKWGAKKCLDSSSVTKGGAGIYYVPHLAGSNYTVQVTCLTANTTAGVISKGNNTFTVSIRDINGYAVDSGFDYTIYGAN